MFGIFRLYSASSRLLFSFLFLFPYVFSFLLFCLTVSTSTPPERVYYLFYSGFIYLSSLRGIHLRLFLIHLGLMTEFKSSMNLRFVGYNSQHLVNILFFFLQGHPVLSPFNAFSLFDSMKCNV